MMCEDILFSHHVGIVLLGAQIKVQVIMVFDTLLSTCNETEIPSTEFTSYYPAYLSHACLVISA